MENLGWIKLASKCKVPSNPEETVKNNGSRRFSYRITDEQTLVFSQEHLLNVPHCLFLVHCHIQLNESRGHGQSFLAVYNDALVALLGSLNGYLGLFPKTFPNVAAP